MLMTVLFVALLALTALETLVSAHARGYVEGLGVDRLDPQEPERELLDEYQNPFDDVAESINSLPPPIKGVARLALAAGTMLAPFINLLAAVIFGVSVTASLLPFITLSWVHIGGGLIFAFVFAVRLGWMEK